MNSPTEKSKLKPRSKIPRYCIKCISLLFFQLFLFFMTGCFREPYKQNAGADTTIRYCAYGNCNPVFVINSTKFDSIGNIINYFESNKIKTVRIDIERKDTAYPQVAKLISELRDKKIAVNECYEYHNEPGPLSNIINKFD